MLIGNYNESKEDKIGWCKFERIFDDSEIKKAYDARKESENNQEMKIEIIIAQEDNIEDIVIDAINSEEIEQRIQDVIIEKVTEEKQYEIQGVANKVNKNEV